MSQVEGYLLAFIESMDCWTSSWLPRLTALRSCVLVILRCSTQSSPSCVEPPAAATTKLNGATCHTYNEYCSNGPSISARQGLLSGACAQGMQAMVCRLVHSNMLQDDLSPHRASEALQVHAGLLGCRRCHHPAEVFCQLLASVAALLDLPCTRRCLRSVS